MNQIDYNLIMAAKAGPTPNEYKQQRLSLQQMANTNRANDLKYRQELDAFQQNQLAQQRQNTIRQRLSLPDAIDQNTGAVTPQAMQDIYGIDQDYAQAMSAKQADINKVNAMAKEQEALANLNQKKAATEELAALTEKFTGAKKQAELHDWEHNQLDKYVSAIDANKPQEARAIYKRIYDNLNKYITVDKSVFKDPSESTLEDILVVKDYIIRSNTTDKEKRDAQMAEADAALNRRKVDIDQYDAYTRRMALNQKIEAKDTKDQLAGIDPDTGKPYTAAQTAKAQHAVDMGRAIDNIESLINKGFDETSITNQVLNVFRNKKQISRMDFLNIAKTPEQRRYLQAQLDFMVPHLRDQSGAAINADEYVSEASRYFPTAGETAEDVAQKRNARIMSFGAMKTAAGGQYDRILQGAKEEVSRRESERPEASKKLSFDDLVKKHQGAQ